MFNYLIQPNLKASQHLSIPLRDFILNMTQLAMKIKYEMIPHNMTHRLISLIMDIALIGWVS